MISDNRVENILRYIRILYVKIGPFINVIQWNNTMPIFLAKYFLTIIILKDAVKSRYTEDSLCSSQITELVNQ